MKIKIIISLFWLLVVSLNINSQVLKRLEKNVQRKVTQRVDRAANRAIDKGLDKAEGAIKETAKGDPKSPSPKIKNTQVNGNSPNNFSSKFDFIPGEKIIFTDDFAQDALGDFPAKWNTNGGGEIITMKSMEEKWLKIPDNTISFPEIKGTLPQNFTVEFDLLYPAAGQRPPVTFGFSEVANPVKNTIQHKSIFYFLVPPSVKQFVGYSTSLYSGRESTQEWPVDKRVNKLTHVSIAVNASRVRLYLDDQKIFDLPKAFDKNSYRNNFHFRAAPLIPQPKDGFYITNLRIAASEKDVRSTLIRNRKYSTTGIYFNTASAAIQPASHGIIKEIGDALIENPEVKIEIIGHTDHVGNTSYNQTLSEQRALSIKNYLVKNFAIAESRIVTSGKGAGSPVADNALAEGRAQNRRVDFIKL